MALSPMFLLKEQADMKLFRSSLLILGCLSAFGWFLLNDISFLALFPLIPLGGAMYLLNRSEIKAMFWVNGFFTLLSAVIISGIVAVGVFNGRGLFAVLFLMIGCSFLAVKVKYIIFNFSFFNTYFLAVEFFACFYI